MDGRPVEGTVQAGACFGPLEVVSLVEALVSNGVRVGVGPWHGPASLTDARMARATLMAVLDEGAEFEGWEAPVDPLPAMAEELMEAPYNIPNAFGRGLRFGLAGRFAGKFHPGRGGGGVMAGLVHRLKGKPGVKTERNPAFPNAEPHTSDEGFERYALEQYAREMAAVAAAPGAEPGADESRVKRDANEARLANRALDAALGPDLSKFIDRQWGQRAGVRRRLLDGEITIEEAEEEAYEEYKALESRRLLREVDRERDYGLNKKPLPCFSCGSLKARPSDLCTRCGDDPVQVGTSRKQFDRDYGYGGHDTQAEYNDDKYRDERRR